MYCSTMVLHRYADGRECDERPLPGELGVSLNDRSWPVSDRRAMVANDPKQTLNACVQLEPGRVAAEGT